MIAATLEARRRSALSVSVACNPDSAAEREADIAIDVVVGPEFIAGSTGLKAGSAQKLVSIMLTARDGAQPQDVRQPHGRRARDEREARRPGVLARAGRHRRCLRRGPSRARRLGRRIVKTAIAVILTGASAADVRSRLDAAAGSLRAVL
ncbi:N-acetylmuramic acid 6-phosphate etherase [Curtobacterium sp. MCPF17_001]|nr:N-acetylmuramic acid 6-phosphate etherase [Curtobacterium sp. MCPF17_001]